MPKFKSLSDIADDLSDNFTARELLGFLSEDEQRALYAKASRLLPDDEEEDDDE